MKLATFHVERFRNVLDSGTITVDPAVTCLVGKNESGKTNLLHALHTLRPEPTTRSFDEQQYPRWLQKEHQRSGAYAAAQPISATFELTDDEFQAVNTHFGEGVLQANTWTLGIGYDGRRQYGVEVDEAAACGAFESRLGTITGAVKVAALRAELQRQSQETAPDASGTQAPTDEARKAQAARAELDTVFPESVSLAVFHHLEERMPSLFYFDDYSQLAGRTDIEPLVAALRTSTESALTEAQRTALALLRLGFANEDLVSSNYEKRSGEMEAVAADLTRQVRCYWHQNDHLRLKIDIESEEQTRTDGQHVVNRFLQLRVEDDRHFFTNNLDVRSSGFRWFVSFLASFKEFPSDRSVIVLLDEPALALHARAQRDFLDFIEDTLAVDH